MPLLILFNNFFHDLSTGIWFSSMVITIVLDRWVKEEDIPAVTVFFRKKLPKILNLNLASLGFVFLFGITRALAYYDYEYLPAAGKGQVPALVIKHIFLLMTAGLGIYWQYRMRTKTAKSLKSGGVNGG